MDSYSLAVIAASAGGAWIAAVTARSRPLLALGILFVLASASRVTLETPVGTMRLEHPAIAVLAVALLLTGSWQNAMARPRLVLAAAGAFAAYALVLTLSSALVAPDPISSLRLVAWQAISLIGGWVAYHLTRRAERGVVSVFAVSGAISAFVGIAAAALFLALGPDSIPGIQDTQSATPRVYGWAREANLFASFLAICTPFALEAMRGSRRWLIVVILIVGGLPFGETRGANIALIAGLLVYGVVRVAGERRAPRISMAPAGLATAGLAAAFLVGIVGADLLLPNAVERYIADTATIVEPTTPATADPGSPGGMTDEPTAPATPRSSPAPSRPPPPSLVPPNDTIAFRLERIPDALRDLRTSPWIGLGVGSFGQRHGDPTQGGLPDHLAILVVATLHDGGLLGSLALLLGMAVVAYGLWTAARRAGRAGDRAAVGTAAAFAGSITAMLVAYQATNALHFAINWVIIGAAIAVIARSRATGVGDPGQGMIARRVPTAGHERDSTT